jgi:hypothetical protein
MGITRVPLWGRSGTARLRSTIGLWVAVVVIATIAGCGGSSPAQTPASTTATTHAHARPTRTHRAGVETGKPAPHNRASSAPAGTALAALAALPVKGRAPKTGYSRGQFGDGWATVAGCDTRDRILARDLTGKNYKAGDDCRVQSGLLKDPYTAQLIRFVRGGASEVDIDHVVALLDAWQKGAQQWSRGKRVAFANDPLNLLAVSAHANRSKGDGDAATWLPPNKPFRCEYVARQIAAKRKYGAWVTTAEHDAMARVLGSCPREPLPRGGTVATPPSAIGPVTQSRQHATAAPGKTGSGRGLVFANCAAVRAAGLAPLRRGTADYRANPHLDRDKDGLACE